MSNVHPKPFQIIKINDKLYRILRCNLVTNKVHMLPNRFLSDGEAQLFINDLLHDWDSETIDTVDELRGRK